MGGDALLVCSSQHNDFVGLSASAREGVHRHVSANSRVVEDAYKAGFRQDSGAADVARGYHDYGACSHFEQGTRGGDGGAGGSAVRSPTRAVARTAFLNKISSLIFNPTEWLDLSAKRTLLSQKKISAILGAMGQIGRAHV